MPTDSAAIRIRDLTKSYPGGSGRSAVPVIEGIDLDVRDGEFCCLVGASGCGKSTLLNVIAGLVEYDSGSVHIGDDPVSGIDRRVGYMFQKDTLLPWATALDNVRLPLDATGRKDDGTCERILDKVGLRGFEHYYPNRLSGGMRKRVQLGRLLAQDSSVLLMDEPFGALDAHTKLLMQEEFLRIWEQDGRTVLFVTHDLHEAIALADRIHVMASKPGRIEQTLDVDLPRPRDLQSVMSDPRSNTLFSAMWSLLRDDTVPQQVAATDSPRIHTS